MKKVTYWTQIAYGWGNFCLTWVMLAAFAIGGIAYLVEFNGAADYGTLGDRGSIALGGLVILLANLLGTLWAPVFKNARTAYKKEVAAGPAVSSIFQDPANQ